MIELSNILLLSSTGVLGVFLGAQIAEACLFVPIWKKMNPDDFFEQHKSVGPLIYRFFAPITIAATVIPLVTVAVNLFFNAEQLILTLILGVSTLIFFSTYFLYFKEANQKFSDRSLTNEELPSELAKWESWHWFRIVFEAIAFLSALIMLLIR